MFESASISRLRTCYKIMIVEGIIFTVLGARYLILWLDSSADKNAAADDYYTVMRKRKCLTFGLGGPWIALFSLYGFRKLNSNRSSAIRWSAFTVGIFTSLLLIIDAVYGLWRDITVGHADLVLIAKCLVNLALLILHVFTGYAGLKVFMEMKDGGPSADRSARPEENNVL